MTRATATAGADATDQENASLVAHALDACEAWLGARHVDHDDPAHHWPSLHQPRTLDWTHLVHLRRPEPAFPELFVGPEDEPRERGSFTLTDRRMGPRDVEQEIDYCLSATSATRTRAPRACATRRRGTSRRTRSASRSRAARSRRRSARCTSCVATATPLGALALVCIDNPMCPGTGHRICNDCMKACVFQKQEPVNIPQIETRVLTETCCRSRGASRSTACSRGGTR